MLRTAQEAKLESDKYKNVTKVLSDIWKLIEYSAILGESEARLVMKDDNANYLRLITEILEKHGFIVQTHYDSKYVLINWGKPTNKSEEEMSASYANKLYNEYDINFQLKLNEITKMIDNTIKTGKTSIIVTELEPKIRFVLEYLGYIVKLEYNNNYNEYDEGYYTIDWGSIKED